MASYSSAEGMDMDLPPLEVASTRVLAANAELQRILTDDELQRREVLDTYFTLEHKFRVYTPGSRYVKYRRVVVEWMCEVGEEFHFSTTTTHMATKYLDRLLGTLDVPKVRIQLVAMACILVAAKFDEPDEMLPTLEDLNECAESAYTKDLIRDMESMVLKHLKWDLGVIVPLHFLSLWIDAGAVFPDDRVSGEPVSKRCVKYLLKYVDFFADLGQQEYNFQQYLPSRVAAASIAAGRTALRFEPIWNTQLSILTGISAEEVFPCYRHLWSSYEKNFPSDQRAVKRVTGVQDLLARGSNCQAWPFSPPLRSPVPATPPTPQTPSGPQTPITPSSYHLPKGDVLMSETYSIDWARPSAVLDDTSFEAVRKDPKAETRRIGGYSLRPVASKPRNSVRFHPYNVATQVGS
eukprot:gb/GEZN01007952.1/.p1 GENE.gb/GEZN01007952.1/~~gb/GEZN01007952.1/.p1  ORF type:complete len:407 (-),score=34.21 gb/GEZN01007952.1/:225-1445(-)